jgi:hypothetical protein
MLRLPNIPRSPAAPLFLLRSHEPETTEAHMRLIQNLVDRLQRLIMRYKVTLDYADARARRGPTHEIEWNGAMIGDLRRRSSDA